MPATTFPTPNVEKERQRESERGADHLTFALFGWAREETKPPLEP